MKTLIFSLLMTLVLVCSAHAQMKPMVVHLVIVPSEVASVDYDQVIPELEDKFIQLAGGFTLLGSSRGGAEKIQGITTENNFTYLVAADKNIAAEINAYVSNIFVEEPFILVWTAQRFSLRK